MAIKIYSKASGEITKQIRKVEINCQTYDKTYGNIYLDTSLNFYSEMRSLFLFYEDNKLLSVLSIFMPTAEVAEISAYTLPEYRRKGYFKKLLNEAFEELKRYGQVDILFVCEPQSKAGKEVIEELEAELDFTEYLLKYKYSLSDLENQHSSQIKLQKADINDVEAIVELSQQVFNDDYEDAKSMITKTLEVDNRTQYIATLDYKLIGFGAVSFESNEASIFGLGISPQHQGKGHGRELLNLIVNDLKKRGIQNITIEVESSNKNAFHLYRQCGFEVETSFDYYRKCAAY